MIIRRRLPFRTAILFALPSTIRAFLWSALVYGFYASFQLEFIRIPFLPISTMGIAVSFYVGFKNNAAYDRFWEGRKIWGGVVNASRAWGTAVMSYIRVGDDSPEAVALRRALIYRHLAWINAVRLQLRKKSRLLENASPTTKMRLRNHSDHMRNDWDKEISPFLSKDEHIEMAEKLNPATHMVTRQGEVLAQEEKANRLPIFHQIAMMELLTELYTLQGKAERIKNTPLPRQYAEYSRVFTKVFVYLVPFGLLDVFASHIGAAATAEDQLIYLFPFLSSAALIAWVFETMEGIGDASEDPFERSMNDVPMNGLCRTIERDLRQMLSEPDEMLPEAEQPIHGILY